VGNERDAGPNRKITTTVVGIVAFAASVTYLIPLVAVLWAIRDGEMINAYQLLGGVIILFGVWSVKKRKRME
jgi:drug/metabolite transporter (DMT)-like permease